MAKSHKSATLPPNFLHQAQTVGEENEGFFSKLKKRFKLKRGRYNVDINTGECENVSAVSFKKRESAEVGEQDESPLKYMLGRGSERPAKSASPKISKPASRTSSERIVSSRKEVLHQHTVNKNVEQDAKTGSEKSEHHVKEGLKGNEYSSMKFDREDPVLVKPVNLGNEPKVRNECLLNDDSAIDLDGYDVDSNFDIKTPSHVKQLSSQTTESLPFSSGMTNSCHDVKLETLNNEEPGYASVNDVKRPDSDVKQNSTGIEIDFDPNYESVKDVKDKIRSQGYDQRISKSMESLDDPNYQSINDVKRKKDELFGSNGQKPRKTYSMFESIESLDEPGYESLNDVKKRITEQNFSKTADTYHEAISKESSVETDRGTTESVDLDDSAVGLSVVNDSITVAVSDDTDYPANVVASTELTDSSKSKDSGFESKSSPDQESAENLYSKVRKRSEEPESVQAAKTETVTKKPETKASKEEEFDSDVELSLDPGYAECADAIKGFHPLSVYSDGSGSKMSSCNSLDLSAEDFVTEPGYAECADAIKTGVIKKISVSNERLVDAAKVKRYSVDEATLRKGVSGDIYANPQILFRKRSKLLDDRNSGEFTGSSESLMSNTSAKSKEIEIKKEETPVLEAPPLPARNYSLYLENEEADKIALSTETLDQSGDKILEDVDDAFEEEQCSEKDEPSSESKVDVDVILQMENELKEELRIEPVLKTPDDVDEVTKAIESKFPDTLKLQTDILNDNCEDEELCRYATESLSGTSGYEDETCNSGEFIVTVPDKSGGTKLLKICEKKESLHIQEKRKSVKHSCVTKGTCEVSGDASSGSKSSTNCDEKTCDIYKEQLDRAEDKVEKLLQDYAKRGSSEQFSNVTGKGFNAYHSKNQSKSETESRSVDNVIPLTVSQLEMIDEGADCRTRLKEELNISEQNSADVTNNPQDLSNNIPSNKIVEVERESLLEAPLRMISFSSFDSDEDFDAADQLPKLEIVEGEWENVFEKNTGFDSNIGRVDVEGKDVDSKEVNNDVDTLESARNEAFDEVDGFVTRTDQNMDTKAAFEHDCKHILSEMSAANKKATLDTKLCVVDPQDSVPDKLVSDMLPVNDGVDTTDPVLVCDENENTSSTEVSDESETSPQATTPRFCELSSYSDMIPNLYNDSEPTHMSLNEIMTLSGSDISAFQFSPDHNSHVSSADNHSSSHKKGPTTSASNIPQSTDSPPPRPPSISTHGPGPHTPTDEIPPPYRLPEEDSEAACSGESPPAIPPRAKIRKQPRPVSASQDFMESMRQLKDCGWYWGPLSWEEAEQKLANKPEGTFLVRDSSDERYILSLSFKNQGRVHHTRIEHHKGHFSFWSQPDSHGKSTIKEFIEQCVNNSRNGRFLYFIRPSGPGSPPMPIHLLHPVSRFVQMRSLQHMCRFRILQMVRRDHIEDLPVPTRIKLYLKEAQYYVEYLDD